VSHPDSFGAKSTLEVGGTTHEIFRLDALQSDYDVARLPYCLKVLLENLLRNEDGESVTKQTIESVAQWAAGDEPSHEIAYSPSRVLMQDFTGVPAIVDLAAMRDAMEELGGDASDINPLVPVELVIDHSIQVDSFAEKFSFQKNAEKEFERNGERYAFLRWGQTAFDNFSVVPPNTGICHQVNLEYLSRVVTARDGQAFPDTLVGTDSHTTMVNGLGVLGWGVGGIEAEAAMLGQPVSMLLPQVVGFRMENELPEGATATDLVLTVTEMLRERGVVGKFVEFFGPGLANMPLADRATIGNMSPEFGSTCAIFPVDAETLRYMEFTGRPTEQLELVETYAREQGMFHDEDYEEPTYSDTLELDLSTVEPSLAGPKRPQDRISLSNAAEDFLGELSDERDGKNGDHGGNGARQTFPASDPPSSMAGQEDDEDDGEPAHQHGDVATQQIAKRSAKVSYGDEEFELEDGAVVIAAITSCTNTSNPAVMLGAGLLARNAVEKGLTSKPWVKTSLAPGSKVVMDYYDRADLIEPLEKLGFNLVGYGCTTCIGNSGPLPDEISTAIEDEDLTVCSVLSGNRNFEGRIHPEVKNNYLASPPLCVAYALAGRMDLDLYEEPLGQDDDGNDVYLKDIWPSQEEIHAEIESAVESDMFRKSYGEVFEGDENWESMEIPEGDRYAWDDDSTYVKRPPYFEGMEAEAPEGFEEIKGARILAKLGDSVTTDHISPAGAIKKDTPGGKYLIDHGVEQKDFNSYGSRRGNHEVMMRGTFANVRLRNQLAPDTEGGYTKKDGEEKFIFDASVEYQEDEVPLGVLAGKEYGSGSSRDWAAKGPRLLGIRFVIAESYERIHRSNLVGMGILPLQFPDGEDAESLGLEGTETYDLEPLEDGATELKVTAKPESGDEIEFTARVRIDTPNEWLYYRHGGILHFVLRGRA
jgi:aconitate hydratase